MRIIIDTDALENFSVTSEKSSISADNVSRVAAASTHGEGGSAPASMDAMTTARVQSVNDGFTIDAGPPSADLVAAIMMASVSTKSGEFIDAGSAPSF